MNQERIEEIYEYAHRVSIDLPENETHVSKGEILRLLGLCKVAIQKINSYFVEITKDLSIVEKELAEKEDYYEIKLEEQIIENPEIVSLSSDTAKRKRAKYVLRKEHSVVVSLKSDQNTLKGIQKVLQSRLKEIYDTENSIKKIWEVYNAEMRSSNRGTNETTPVQFVDENVQNVVLGTDDDDSENPQNENLAALTLYDAPQKSNNDKQSHKANYESKDSPIISESSEIDDILDSL